MIFTLLLVLLSSHNEAAADIVLSSPRCIPFYHVGEPCRFICSTTLTDVSFWKGSNFTFYENKNELFVPDSIFDMNMDAISLLVPNMSLVMNQTGIQCHANLTKIGELSSEVYILQAQLAAATTPSNVHGETQETQQTTLVKEGTSTTSISEYDVIKSSVPKPEVNHTQRSSYVIGGILGTLLVLTVLLTSVLCLARAIYYCCNHKTKNKEVSFTRQESCSVENGQPIYNTPTCPPQLKIVTHKNYHTNPSNSGGSESYSNTIGQPEPEFSQSLAHSVPGNLTKLPQKLPSSNISRNGLAIGDESDNAVSGNNPSSSIDNNTGTTNELTTLPECKAEPLTSSQGINTGAAVVGFNSVNN